MDAIKFLKEEKRISKDCEIECYDCPLYRDNNGYNMGCRDLKRKLPKEYVEIVETWSKEHPAKTRQSEFLKMFPTTSMYNGIIEINPCDLKLTDYDNKKCDTFSTCFECRKAFWLEEIE